MVPTPAHPSQILLRLYGCTAVPRLPAACCCCWLRFVTYAPVNFYNLRFFLKLKKTVEVLLLCIEIELLVA
jgi:hypothetical protein